MSSRREFLQAAGAGLALAQAGAGARIRDGAAIRSEIERRAAAHLRQRYLVVDYYRIRRTLAYPLPVRSLSLPPAVVPSIKEYPWATWMMWALEERVHSLGWAAEWTGRADFAQAAAADLEGLAAFPKYCQFAQPDLSSGHAGRLLWAASVNWKWVGKSLREKIREACRRHVEEVAPLVLKQYGSLRSKQDLLGLKEPYRKLANIPLIGTAGAALTASVSSHPAAGDLNRAVHAVFGAILDLRSAGHTEGVAYDGYILDFVADWLHALPAAERGEVLRHPNLRHFLDECYMLASPGAMEEVAQLSDVEAREMPFHYSAQAKLEALAPDPIRGWYLPEWRPNWMRADALAALRPILARLQGKAPEPGALDAHYAAVLRTGWEDRDLAVAMSCTSSQMGHLQNDNGTLVIGTAGRWIVSDPGYQQYMQDAERDFTLGPAAHNYPHPGGVQQNAKRGKLTRIGGALPGALRADVDLSACYPASAGVSSVRRTVWLDGRACVVVADLVEGGGPVAYHWHGHPEASWWARDGWVLLHLPGCDLWMTTPNSALSLANLERHPASRGQMTVAAKVDAGAPAIWWVFAVGPEPPRMEAAGDLRSIQVSRTRFEV